MKLLFIILLLSGVCYAQVTIPLTYEAIEINGEQYYSSEAGQKVSITYYSETPIATTSIYDLEQIVSQCDSARVKGWQWKNKKDEYKSVKMLGGLHKPKYINKKDKKIKDKDPKEEKMKIK